MPVVRAKTGEVARDRYGRTARRMVPHVPSELAESTAPLTGGTRPSEPMLSSSSTREKREKAERANDSRKRERELLRSMRSLLAESSEQGDDLAESLAELQGMVARQTGVRHAAQASNSASSASQTHQEGRSSQMPASSPHRPATTVHVSRMPRPSTSPRAADGTGAAEQGGELKGRILVHDPPIPVSPMPARQEVRKLK